MRIDYRQTGGFVGGSWRAVIDTAELPLAEAQTLTRLVEAADVFTLPRSILRIARLTTVDPFSYAVTVTDGRRKRSVHTDDIYTPAKRRPLVDYRSQRAARNR